VHAQRGLAITEHFAKLSQQHWGLIRRCGSAECGRLFVAGYKRKKDCSTKCGEVKRQRKHRAAVLADDAKRRARAEAQKEWRIYGPKTRRPKAGERA
jgi:hypothetical protein